MKSFNYTLSLTLILFCTNIALAGESALKIATYNVGMLDRVSPVPLLDEKEQIFSEAIQTFVEESEVGTP